MAPLSGLALVGALSIVVEVVIEALKPGLRPLIDALKLPKDVNPYFYIGLATGLIGAVLFGANALQAFGFPADTAATATFGVIVTGLVTGRGSNFAHDVISGITAYLAQ